MILLLADDTPLILKYGLPLWGNYGDINTIIILEKCIIRAIYKLSSRLSLRSKILRDKHTVCILKIYL